METFLNQSKNPVRDSYIWNMAGSFLLAFQSVIILMVLTRICDLSEAGIFTIAYANANLFLQSENMECDIFRRRIQRRDIRLRTILCQE